MSDLLTTTAAGAIHPDRPPPMLPGIDARFAAAIDIIKNGKGETYRRSRLPRTGFTNMTMALRCRDMRSAGLVAQADDMWASWCAFADAVDAHVEGIEWIRGDDTMEGDQP